MVDKLNIESRAKTVLVISSPAITLQIIKTTIELANARPDYQFTLRLHPQEDLSIEQSEKIKLIKNINVDDKKVDSLVSILLHQYCIGENSSVLYEALDYGKQVGKIMYNGLFSERQKDKDLGNIFYLRSQSSFYEFIHQKSVNVQRQFGVYDDFKSDVLERILKNKV